jgi:hypothetical protein
MHDLEQLWDELKQQPVHRFADWPNKEVPKGKPGVYLIYQGNDLKYVGMASANLYGLLNQHARGKRSGDQLCVYVGDRLVMSKLSIDQMKGVFSGEYSLDDAIKEFVRSQLSYRYLVVADDPTARALEKHGLEIAKGQGTDLLNSI